MEKDTVILTNMKSVRFGIGLAELRVRAKYTQKQLAEKLGITEQILIRLEEGCISELNISLLKNAARVLVSMRGKPSIEDLVNLFLYVPRENTSYMI